MSSSSSSRRKGEWMVRGGCVVVVSVGEECMEVAHSSRRRAVNVPG